MNVDIGDNLCVTPGPDHESRGAVVTKYQTDVRFGKYHKPVPELPQAATGE